MLLHTHIDIYRVRMRGSEQERERSTVNDGGNSESATIAKPGPSHENPLYMLEVLSLKLFENEASYALFIVARESIERSAKGKNT